MSKVAVIRTGGKQYKVQEGQALRIEKIQDVQEGDNIKLETLLVASPEGEKVDIGQPSLGEKTQAEVIEHGRGKKVKVIKFKNKIRYRREIGHKQPFTKIKITSIK
jgi:large subunit ribosomal protein L21